ncbi:MAG: flavohemoglobin expression-modulating QEGLA motif protein [Candidatus Berkiella sp.]
MLEQTIIEAEATKDMMTKRKTPTPYLENIKALSDELVRAQEPIRILDAIKWNESIKQDFFKHKCKQQPKISQENYLQQNKIDFNAQREVFYTIERQVTRKLGQFNTVGKMLKKKCNEYVLVLRMLEACGTPEFSNLSKLLYGSAKDVFHAGDPTIAELGQLMTEALCQIDKSEVVQEDPRTINAEKAVEILQKKLSRHFQEADKPLRVIISDGIVSDAAAGADYIKLRQDALFNRRDLNLLEVHEGLVHIGTTLNGKLQPYCTFLSKGPPSSTVTQEGLAVLMEILCLVSFPARLKKLANRIRAIELAEEGATFVEIFNFFLEEGYDEDTAYSFTTRVFRGSLPTMGPFTKDLSYTKGFVTVYNFIQLAVKKGKLERIPILFCGKTNLEDIRDLAQLVEEGIVIAPKFLPPQIKDLNAIAAWMCFANFLNCLSTHKIESDYDYLLSS